VRLSPLLKEIRKPLSIIRKRGSGKEGGGKKRVAAITWENLLTTGKKPYSAEEEGGFGCTTFERRENSGERKSAIFKKNFFLWTRRGF